VSPVQPDHSQSLQLILITVWQQDGEKKKSDRRARDKRRRCRKQQQTVCVFTPFGQQMRCEAAVTVRMRDIAWHGIGQKMHF